MSAGSGGIDLNCDAVPFDPAEEPTVEASLMGGGSVEIRDFERSNESEEPDRDSDAHGVDLIHGIDLIDGGRIGGSIGEGLEGAPMDHRKDYDLSLAPPVAVAPEHGDDQGGNGVLGVEVEAVDADDSLFPRDHETKTRLDSEATEAKPTLETDGGPIMVVSVSEPEISQRSDGGEAAGVGHPVDLSRCNVTGEISRNGIYGECEKVSINFPIYDSSESNAASIVDVPGSNEKENSVIDKDVIDTEQMNDNEMKSVKSDVLGPESSGEDRFLVSDLVWGKVRSHPWWPGQIFESSASSAKAMKYFKRNSLLIAYFGDKSFAWIDASRLKPFHMHFPQMEKQSHLEAFSDAVDCALNEVSRRVEFGLSCPCLHGEVYSQLKSQIIVNAGIRGECSRRDGGDRFSGAASFEPMKLVKYLKALARLPLREIDRLEFVVARAQLLAFYRLKGYLQLPQFNMVGGLSEDGLEVPVSGVKEDLSEATEIVVSVYAEGDAGQCMLRAGNLEAQDRLSSEPESISGNGMDTGKEEECTLELDDFSGSHNRRKRKAIVSIYDQTSVKNSRSTVSPSKSSSRYRQTPRVGERIHRIATQLKGSDSIFKFGNEMSQRSTGNSLSPTKASRRGRGRKKIIPVKHDTAAVMLSQLCLAAWNPLEGYNFLAPMVKFFSEFRNSICCKIDLDSTDSGTGKLGLEAAIDSYWTDRIIQCIPEEPIYENQNDARELLPEIPSDLVIPTAKLAGDPEASPNFCSKQRSMSGDLEMEVERNRGDLKMEVERNSRDLEMGVERTTDPMDEKCKEEVESADPLDEKCKEEQFATALILSFTDFNSVPSETNLNRIFSRYGPLEELETKVMKNNRAKVVFKRRSDAETAFSSAGKFSIFGPSLVSYRLKYLSSVPRRAPTHKSKRSKKDVTSVEGNAT